MSKRQKPLSRTGQQRVAPHAEAETPADAARSPWPALWARARRLWSPLVRRRPIPMLGRRVPLEVTAEEWEALRFRVQQLERLSAQLERQLAGLAHLYPHGQPAAGPRDADAVLPELLLTEPVGPAPPAPVWADAERVARELMDKLDETALTEEEAEAWLADRGARGEAIVSTGTGPYDWRLVRVIRGSEAVVVPNLRRPMGQTPLHDYFEMHGYNGVDALKKHQVRVLPHQRRQGQAWHTDRLGTIHG